MRHLATLLALAALQGVLGATGTLPEILPDLFPPLVPGSLAGQTPDTERGAEQEQRVMSAEESMALHHWARRHLEETEARMAGREPTLATEMERLRAMYFLSVEDRGRVGNAWELLNSLQRMLTPGAPQEVVLDAYRGALEVVQAKHARWPPTKLRHLREGVGTLDRLLEGHPENLEIRYLRLVSCYYLPFFLKREESVREDLQLLITNLPHHPDAFSPPVFRGVVEFVLDKGDPDEGERALLRKALQTPVDGGAGPDTPERSRREDTPLREAPGPTPGQGA